jgi:hypothetical protein
MNKEYFKEGEYLEEGEYLKEGTMNKVHKKWG